MQIFSHHFNYQSLIENICTSKKSNNPVAKDERLLKHHLCIQDSYI
ncbi:hypothetical protein M080_4989 [Bacteroides fragilis str. 3397 T10]|nr:hypothetical protein M080_4989 [Bacteroides fragilis str. 3397 T10]